MAKYLIKGNYVGDGVKGLLSEGGTSRKAAVDQLAASLGGSVESLYYAFGSTDVYVIADMPDHVSAAAASLVASASGAVSTEIVVLLTAEELDAVAAKAPNYRPPGG